MLERLFEDGLILDAALAQSGAQREAMIALREHVLESLMAEGRWQQYDIALPLAGVAIFLDRLRQVLPDNVRSHVIGHLGDGNLHLSLMPGAEDADEPSGRIYDLVLKLSGSFSAEHGIGRSKAGLLATRKDPGTLAAMRAIKAALDPAGIMNAGGMLA